MLSNEIIAGRCAFSPSVTRLATRDGGDIAHSVYGLIDCPDLEDCKFVLVNRAAAPEFEVLLVGELDHDAPSLNRAAIRHLGANLDTRLTDIDVHVFLSAIDRPAAPKRASTTRRTRRDANARYNRHAAA